MTEPFSLDLKPLVEIVWRRRYLLIVPILLMVPLSIALMMLAPKVYVASSLLLLQEEGRDNPLLQSKADRDIRMQERAAGIEALAKSDLVLSKVMKDLLGDEAPTTHAEITHWKDALIGGFTLDPIGNDFVALSLKSNDREGLGRRVTAMTMALLDVMLAEEGTLSAAQAMVAKRKEELEAAEQKYAAHISKLHELPQPFDATSLDAARSQLQEKSTQLDKAVYEVLKAKRELIKITWETDTTAQPKTTVGEAEEVSKGVRMEAVSRLKTATNREAELRAEITALRERLAASQEAENTENKIRELARAVDEAKSRYADYTRRYAAPPVRSLGILNAPDRIKVIELPSDPEFPISSRLKYALAGIIGSLGLALGLVVAAELTDRTVRRDRDFEKIVGAPVLTRLT